MAVIVALAGASVASASPAFAGPSPDAGPVFVVGLTVQESINLGMLLLAALIFLVLWYKDVLRPRSLDRAGKRDLSGLPTPIWFVAASTLFLAPMIGAGFAFGLPESVLGPAESLRRTGIALLVGYLFAGGCAALLVYLLLPRASATAGLRFRARDFLVGTGAFLLALPVIQAVSMASVMVATAITGHPPAPIAHATLQQIIDGRSNPWIFAVIGAVVLGAPVVEEFTYRIFLQSGLMRVLVSPTLAVFLTSAVFALVHRMSSSPVPWHAIPVLFSVGLATGIAYERTRRPGVPITIHVLFNATNIALVLFTDLAG